VEAKRKVKSEQLSTSGRTTQELLGGLDDIVDHKIAQGDHLLNVDAGLDSMFVQFDPVLDNTDKAIF
jgi:hypothetical protein